MSVVIASHVEQTREDVARRRVEIARSYDAAPSGAAIAAAITAFVDGVITRLAHAALSRLDSAAKGAFESDVALVALGGYGRSELAPYSDVDVLFLCRPATRTTIEPVVKSLIRDLWDAGLVLGCSMRSMPECLCLAQADIASHTALLESRHVTGNPWLTAELWEEVHRLTRGHRADAFVAAALAARTAEQRQFGANPYLLEPDVKRSQGGLRDLHLLRWVARARHRIDSMDRLGQVGWLAAEDTAALADAREFLLRLRHGLHFHAGRAQDVLTRKEQLRLASLFGYGDRPGMLGVEEFMRTYYRHGRAIAEVTERFVRRSQRRSRWRSFFEPLLTERVDDVLTICNAEVTAPSTAQTATLDDAEGQLCPFEVAAARGLRVADELLEHLRRAAPPADADLTAARQRLLAMLGRPGHLAPTLRQLRAVGLLQRLLPEFEHACGLTQFNQYHKYTVDEHALLCVAHAEGLLNDQGPAGQVYEAIRHKEILHLALLLHDLGKGYAEDHSERGRQIALETAARFGLEPRLAEMLVFLVHRHLMMAHLAFRRDTSDPSLLNRFAREVGTPELLRMLFVLTVCDIAAVGPDTWNSWKADVLADFFARAMETLSGERPTLHPQTARDEVRSRLRRRLAGLVAAAWMDAHLSAMPAAYLLSTPVEQIAEHLQRLNNLPPEGVLTTSRYDPATDTVEYTVYTTDGLTPGLFSKIAGVLAAKGLQVLTAQISTHQDGVVVDRFEVVDGDYRAEPPPERCADVAETIRQVLRGQQSVPEVFRTHQRFVARNGATAQPREPTRVCIDNDSSDGFTILDVFAADRQGLLYVIARTIFELGLSVRLAKVATSRDQVLDVFYVTERDGSRVTGDRRLLTIQGALLGAIERFEQTGEFTATP